MRGVTTGMAIAAATLLLAGCASSPVPRKAVFDPTEYSPYDANDGAAIEGQVFARQRGGGVVTGAGSTVHLLPSTAYTREAHAAALAGVTLAPPPDDRLRSHYRTITADAAGRFLFDGLAAGDYLLLSAVRWEVPVGYTTSVEGGTVGAQVTVSSGERARVMLNR